MNVLASAGHVNQSSSEIPEGGAVIESSLLLRCNRESRGRQGLAKTKETSRTSRPMNGYRFRGTTIRLFNLPERETQCFGQIEHVRMSLNIIISQARKWQCI